MDFIPPEFVGKARAFHRKVAIAEDAFAIVREGIWDSLDARAVRKIKAKKPPTFRKPETIDLFRRWRDFPLFGRLDEPELIFHPRRVEMRDLVLVAGSLEHSNRPGVSDDSVACAAVRMIADATILEDGQRLVVVDSPIIYLVNFSLHALARWYQRTFSETTDDALCRALWAGFLVALEALQHRDYEFRIPCTAESGGAWYGHTSIWQVEEPDRTFLPADYRALSVRTFTTDRRDTDVWTGAKGARPVFYEEEAV